MNTIMHGVDPKCYELAQHFLAGDDERDLTDVQRLERRMSLAKEIQNAVESWMDDEAPPPRKS